MRPKVVSRDGEQSWGLVAVWNSKKTWLFKADHKAGTGQTGQASTSSYGGKSFGRK
jgi:hypothetical protein